MNQMYARERESTSPEAAGASQLSLEVTRRYYGDNFCLPMRVKSLSARGVILEGAHLPENLDLQSLAGGDGVIHVSSANLSSRAQVPCKVIWARSEGLDSCGLLVSLEMAEPDLAARRILEDQLINYPKDMKELWDQWDQAQETRPKATRVESGVYLVGLAAVMGGLLMYYLGQESIKLLGSIMAIYGSLFIAGKSAWTMWRRKAVSTEPGLGDRLKAKG